jgi:hypothetical protein
MANTIRDYSATAASNTAVDGADISEGCSPAGINDAIRGVMADLKDVSTGSVSLESPAADSLTVTGNVGAATFSGDGSALTGVEAFPAGTKMLFGQTAAPTGWTKITTDDDAALRIVSGTVGSGGSSGLSTALATPTVTGTIAGSTGSHTLSTSEIPSHQHAHRQYQYQSGQGVKSVSSDQYRNSTIRFQTSEANGSAPTGGGGSHSHSLSATFSGGTAAINVKYVDVIMASKD